MSDATSDVVTGIGIVDAALAKAVSVPSTAVRAHVDRLRRRNPEATPMEIVLLLEKQYLTTVSASGGAVGAAAAVPAIGTGTGIALTSAEVATFFATSAAFALAVADVHGIAVEDTARRRAMLMATVLGEQGSKALTREAGLSGSGWARAVLVNMPTTTIRRVNNVLTRKLIRRQAGKQGALALGRLAPFGIGAVVGATGARALGRTVVSSARTAFGPPPAHFPRIIEVAAVDATAPIEAPRRRLLGTRRTKDRPIDAGTPRQIHAPTGHAPTGQPHPPEPTGQTHPTEPTGHTDRTGPADPTAPGSSPRTTPSGWAPLDAAARPEAPRQNGRPQT